MRVSALYELDSVFERDVVGWSKQEMNVFRHDDEGMKAKASLTSISI